MRTSTGSGRRERSAYGVRADNYFVQLGFSSTHANLASTR
jgi:hypothetical protein